MMSRTLKIVLVLLILVPLGFATKFYHGPAAYWVNNYAGDVLYPMFWFFLLAAAFPKLSYKTTAWIVFLFSSADEVSQLFQFPFLQFLRQSFIGRTIVGSGFQWADFFYYAAGSFLALLLAEIVLKNKPQAGRSQSGIV